MNKRENFLSLIKRKGYEKIPVEYGMCPSLIKNFFVGCTNSFVRARGACRECNCIFESMP